MITQSRSKSILAMIAASAALARVIPNVSAASQLPLSASDRARIYNAEVAEKSLVLAAVSASAATFGEPEDILDFLEATGSPAPTKIVGDLAQTSVSQTIVFTGSTTSSSAVITSPSSTTGLAIGQTVTGAGVPANTTITILTPLTLSASATATGSGVTFTVVAETQVISLSEWTINFKLKTADTTTTDDATWESSLPSTKSWDAKAKFMFVSQDVSQSTYILSAINSLTSPKVWNFFPTIAVGREAWQGLAYVDSITITAGMGKVVGLDISLKGTGPLTQVVQLAPVAVTNTVTGLQAEV